MAAYSTGKADTHRANVLVPDERLDQLCALFESKKLVHASIDYIDPVGIERENAGQGSGLGDEMLHAIANADALAAVVRAFEDDSGAACDPQGDFEALALEFTMSDLQKVDNRLERVEAQIQRIGGDQRKRLEVERDLVVRLKAALENERPIRALEFSADETKLLKSFQFLTVKPLLVVINTAEGADAAETDALLESLREAAPKATTGRR